MFAMLISIVEAFKVLKGYRLGLLPCFVNHLFDLFILQFCEDRFGHRIGPTITSSAHAGA
jgi:hypothetical protein